MNQKYKFPATLDSEHWLICVKASCGSAESWKSDGGYAKDRILWTLVFQQCFSSLVFPMTTFLDFKYYCWKLLWSLIILF